MSIGKKVKCAIDLERLTQVAEGLGYSVFRNCVVLGWQGQALEGGKSYATVIKSKEHRFEMGFDGKKMIADWHGDHVLEDMARIMPEYYRRYVEDATRYTVTETVRTEPTKVVLRTRRM